MDYDQAGIMSASTWFKATWKDYRLQWDPKQYGGIENIKIGSWTYDGHHLNLTAYAGDEVLELSDMSKNTPYIVTSQKGDAIQNKYYECCTEPYMSFNFGFTMKRAFAVVDGKKVMKIDSKEFEELFEAYKVSF